MATIGLSLQGGGALGAYQLGVIEALSEKRLSPLVVSGVSIGAVNAAVLCAPRQRDPIDSLRGIWHDFSRPSMPLAGLPIDDLIAALGNPSMYSPRVDYPFAWQWTSFYDTSPLRTTLERHVDFSCLNPQGKGPRLIITATNIETGELDVFDSKKMQITPEHVIASGSIPPGFPETIATDEQGRENTYWDAAIFDNTPLEYAINRLWDSEHPDLLVVVNLFPKGGSVPQNMLEVFLRMFEILFSYKLLRDTRIQQRNEVISEYGHKVERAMQLVDEHLPHDAVDARAAVAAVRDHDAYRILQTWFSVFERILKIEYTEDEAINAMYDFSDAAIERRRRAGYRDALVALEDKRLVNDGEKADRQRPI